MFYEGYPSQITWKINPKNGVTIDEPTFRRNLKKKDLEKGIIKTFDEKDSKKWQFKLKGVKV